MGYKAAIFDMDGTILDTAGDLGTALNYAMEKTGHKHDFTRKQVYRFFGSGIVVAISRALALEKGAGEAELVEIGETKSGEEFGVSLDEVERIRQVYKPYYDAHCDQETRPFPGVIGMLRTLREAGVLTAVVSNKPDSAVQILSDDLFAGLLDLSVGEKSGIRRKPAKDMTAHAMEVLGVTPEESVYIGDTEIDMETAENTGLPCIMVNWGFRDEEELKALGARQIVSSADELCRAILGESGT